MRKEATVQPHRPTVQRLAVKTNLLYDAILMPSLEVEYRIADRWTVNLEGDMAWWNNDGKHKCYQVAANQPGGTVVVRTEARQPVQHITTIGVRRLHVVRPRKQQRGLSGRGRNGGVSATATCSHRTAALAGSRYRSGVHAQQVRRISSHRRALRVPADKTE